MTRKILVRKFVAIPPAMNAEVPFELPDDAEHVTVSLYNDGLVVLQYVLDAPEEEEEEVVVPEPTPAKKRVKQLA